MAVPAEAYPANRVSTVSSEAGQIGHAADDDPGGIVADSQASSQFGHAMLRAVMFASACGAVAVDGFEYSSLDQTKKGIRLHSQLIG